MAHYDYSFDWANVHFVVLDSFDTPRGPLGAGAMADWLDLDLAATLQDWIVVFWHHPPYTKGSHDSDTEIELVEMRENLLPILENHGVDLVLCGHSHSYERSFFIDGHYGDSSTFGPAVTVDGGDGSEGGDGTYSKIAGPHQGTVYTVAGSSGKISGGPLNHPAMFVSLNVLGSVILEFHGSRLDSTFLDADGVVRDGFTILKDDADGDGIPDVNDCAPASQGVAFPPGGVGPTLMLDKAEGARLRWLPSPYGRISDVYRGTILSGTGGAGPGGLACLEPGSPDADAIDTFQPPLGTVMYYVVGGRNICGPGPLDPGETREVLQPCEPQPTDEDVDGVQDLEDNCPLAPNPGQADRDRDFVGDPCDNCPDAFNPDQADGDGDGTGDVCD